MSIHIGYKPDGYIMPPPYEPPACEPHPPYSTTDDAGSSRSWRSSLETLRSTAYDGAPGLEPDYSTDGHELPAYSTGADVSPIRDARNSDDTGMALTIEMDRHSGGGTNTYDVGDLLSGTLRYRAWTVDQDVALVGIVLESHEITATPDSFGVASNRVTKLTYHIVPAVAMPKRGFREGFVYRFPFSLQVPDMRPEACGCAGGEHSQLAPTVGVPGGALADRELLEAHGGVPDNVARVYYRLRAFVKVVQPGSAKFKTLHVAYHDLRLQPSYELGPLREEEVPVSGVAQVTRVMKESTTGFWRTSRKVAAGSLCISVPSQPLVFALDEPFSTKVPVGLSFAFASPSTTGAASRPEEELPQVSKVVLELVTETRYSTNGEPLEKEAHAGGAGDDVSKSAAAAAAAMVTVCQSAVLATARSKEIPRWTPAVGAPHPPTPPPPPHFEVSVPVALNWDVTSRLSPSFESCAISRCYRLRTCVYVQGTKTPVRVETGVRVVRSRVARSSVPAVTRGAKRAAGSGSGVEHWNECVGSKKG